jgi:cytochrome bd-type quinol oxidase subunit 1
MNYPVWELYTTGGGLFIACIAVIHVYVAHFAVGGGLFLVWAEKRAYRQNSDPLLAYVKQHTKFFLLLTMVFGSITGVGIWFTISLLNPSATSTLIHTFVFGWATEWVCFLGEIVALFIYFYTFGKISRKNHLKIGWLYFIFAWLSLFLINGIIDFMLTPGQWLQDKSFWSGFFNPSMWPALAFRTAVAFMFAGVFGFLTSMFIKEKALRDSMNRACALWIIIPFALMVASGYWYFSVLPDSVKLMVTQYSPELLPYVNVMVAGGAVLFIGAVFLALSLPLPVKKITAFIILIFGLVYMGGFEFLREGGRRPYAIYNHTYANAIKVTDQEQINAKGFLASAKWVFNRQITPENKLAAGRELFRHQCSFCHSVGGPMKDILKLTAGYSEFGIDSRLDGQGKVNPYMPPFMGTVAERKALAAYIVQGLHTRKDVPDIVVPAEDKPVDIPVFDPDEDEYVLLAWNNLGMHCISDSDPYWVLLPPANDLFAQVIRRGELPEVVTQGVEITYAVEKGFENPSAHVKFWDHVKSNFGTQPEKNIGLSGNGLSGTMHLSQDLMAYEASLIPVVPYPDDGSYNPYPTFTIEARDKKTGKVLAKTRTVAPTATEMGCKNCHGGQWRVNKVAGFTDETSANILALHDKNSGTTLLEMAENGKPQLCQSCHADPILGTKGKPDLLNFPAAIHGWHANFLSNRDTSACYKCHPSRPDGPTQCLRGAHANNLDCTFCHGYLEDHALSLLKKEEEMGKPGAKRLMAHLTPRTAKSLEEINPRTPWLNEPDCLNCHVDFERPDIETASGFNRWTQGPEELFRLRHEYTGTLMCQACHGATHAVYPAKNKLSPDLDNIQPLQYQKNRRPMGFKNCWVCHMVPMNIPPAHHPMRDMAFMEDITEQ